MTVKILGPFPLVHLVKVGGDKVRGSESEAVKVIGFRLLKYAAEEKTAAGVVIFYCTRNYYL
jgi:hypothetical protein